uniref:Replication protein A subunit n=1 Tax=Parastrongyloides trichosuri TaxID=131310 RepID=A0A0N4ZNU9_PARTI
MTSYQPRLTKNFFQELCSGKTNGREPILQVMNCRYTANEKDIRLRLNDGTYTYASILIPGDYARNINIIELEKRKSIIKILEYIVNKIDREGYEKVLITIKKFSILNHNCDKVIGKPIPFVYKIIPVDETQSKEGKQSNQIKNVFDTELPNIVSRSVASVMNGAQTKNDEITLIKDIHSFCENWKIIGKVTSKSDIVKFDENCLFKFVITDNEGSSIQLISFGALALKFYKTIILNNSYFVKGKKKNISRKTNKYNPTDHDYEIKITSDVVIKEMEKEVELPKEIYSKFNRLLLSEVQTVKEAIVDIVVIVIDIDPIANYINNSSKKKKRIMTVTDESNIIMEIFFWDNFSDVFDDSCKGKVVQFQRLRKTTFRGVKRLTFCYGTQYIMNPEIQITEKLLKLLDKKPNVSEEFLNNLFDEVKTLYFIDSLQSRGFLADGQEFTFFGKIINIRKVYALSCPSIDCRNDIIKKKKDLYFCNKCDKEYKDYVYKFKISLLINDGTKKKTILINNNIGEVLFEKTLEELITMDKENNQEYLDLINNICNNYYIFKVKTNIHECQELNNYFCCYFLQKIQPNFINNSFLHNIVNMIENT